MTRRERLLIALLAGLTVLRLWWCGRFELSPDEAYYWLWSKRLDWAYFSKGPGIALAIRAATSAFGDTAFGVRWLSPVLALGTTGLLWLLVRDAVSRRAATATAFVLQVVPLFAVGSLLMTIDPLSVFFWTLALLCGWRALRSDAAGWWLACGAAGGLGFLCKYTNALVLLGVVVAVLAARRSRRGVALLLAAFLPFTLPPLLWNAQRGWPTARHLFERGGLARDGAFLQPRETLEFVVVHFGTWSPVLFALTIAALPAILRRAREHEGTRYLLLASAPVLLLYCALALHEAGEANWTAPGLLGLLPLAIDRWLQRWDASRGLRVATVAGLVIAASLSLVIANTDLLRAAGLPLRAKQDPSTRLRGWADTAAVVRELAPGTPVVANHYGVAAELAFHSKGLAVDVVPAPHPKNQFHAWNPAGTLPPSFTYVSDRQGLPEALAATCTPIAERGIDGPGGTLRTIRLYSCTRMAGEAP